MRQEYNKYTTEDQEVWRILFERQLANLKDKSCKTYLQCIYELDDVLNADAIPRFEDLGSRLEQATGWNIHVVPGLIPVDEFFALLNQRMFCSSTWVRSREMLDYLEEPDMFHDITGHTPLLINQKYADFMQEFGALGVKYADDSNIVVQLQRLYWFTIEFGVMKGVGKPLVYGAGIASSFGETNHIYEKGIEILDFDLEKVMNNDFVNSEIQMRYYAIEQLDDLYEMIDELRDYLKTTSHTSVLI